MHDYVVDYDTCNSGCGALFFDDYEDLDSAIDDIADELLFIIDDSIDEVEAIISEDGLDIGRIVVLSNGEWDYYSYV